MLAHHSNGRESIARIDCCIDRQSFMPLYLQIKNWLLNKIGLGELSDGDAIPSEAQLAEALGVSRGTVRQALYELRMEGYIVREKGRGSFVERSMAVRESTCP
jgi:DNA-binding GntR family transcriptional regulator